MQRCFRHQPDAQAGKKKYRDKLNDAFRHGGDAFFAAQRVGQGENGNHEIPVQGENAQRIA